MTTLIGFLTLIWSLWFNYARAQLTFATSSKQPSLSAGASDAETLRINKTYTRVMSCLKKRWNAVDLDTKYNFRYPDNAQEHYNKILEMTARYRTTKMHYYAGYEGPWIENHFITTFIDKPLSYFNGLIPLFVQWIDNHLLNKLKEIEAELNKVLRKDVIYFAVSQGDNGLDLITYGFPNILVFSSGGFGHVALPLIKGELPWRAPTPASFQQTVGFFGTYNAYRSRRAELLNMVKEACEVHKVSFKVGQGDGWLEGMAATKFNLAPRGYGRSSFRFAESIQLGRIPIFLHHDVSWAPYHGTNMSVDKFGFEVGANRTDIETMVLTIKNMNESEFQRRLDFVKAIRHYYTYAGTMEQIARFFENPFGAFTAAASEQETSGSAQTADLKCLDVHPVHWKR